MRTFSTISVISWLSVLASVLALIGCGDKNADTPSAVTQVKMADPLEFLRGVNPADSRGKLLFKKMSEGDKYASFLVAGGYLQGKFGTPNKPDQAIAYLNTAAEGGAWEAMSVLYKVYDLPQFKNSAKQEYWKKAFIDAVIDAANQGNSKAMERLGNMYSLGEVVTKDEMQSCSWFFKAAVAGEKLGQREAGECALKRKGGLDEAIRLLTLAADKGDGLAMAKLLEIYRTQRPDKKLEDSYFNQLLSLSSPDENYGPYFAAGPYCAIGANYESSCEHPTFRKMPMCKKCSVESKSRAISLYQKAADLGNASAARRLGDIYEKAEKDDVMSPDNARQWYERAAELGDALAQLKVGSAYLFGLGATPKDTEKAAIWLTKAAIKGVPNAQTILGEMNAKGVGVPEDLVLAYAWLNLAISNLTGTYASKDRIETESFRNVLEKRMTSEQIAEAQRLASNWTYGQALVRDGASSTPAVKSGTLTKKATGTVFVVSKTGHAITNQHVVQGCKELRIEGRDGIAKILVEDKVNDLALLQIQGTMKDAASITSEPGKLRQGEEIVAFGFPLNSVLSSGGNLTPGVVSALTGLGNNTHQIQITAPIQPGSSGSPVLNKKGEVVGVVSMKLSDSKMASATGQIGQNVNFAISGQTLKTFLETHKVSYSTGGFLSFDKNTADLADEARKWTLVAECWK